MSDHRKITVNNVKQQKHWDDGPFFFGNLFESGSLLKMIENLQRIYDSIPAEYRNNAAAEISTSDGFPTFEARYDRHETDAENQEYERAELRAKMAREKDIEEKEINELFRLKNKYWSMINNDCSLAQHHKWPQDQRRGRV